MKKNILLLGLVLVILASMSLVCFGQTEQLIFAGGQLGGWWALQGAAMTEIVHQVYPEIVMDYRPGGGVSNIMNISKKEADIAFSQNVATVEASQGIESFEGNKQPGLSAIMSTNVSMIQFVTLKKTEISSPRQIIDEKMPVRISVGERGAASELNNRRLFAEYGATWDDINSWGGKVFYKEKAEANQMMSSGLLDVMLESGACPLASLMELAVNFDLRLLPVDEEIVEALHEKYGYGKFWVTPEDYDFVTEDSLTFGTATIVLVREDLSEEIVYKIIKAIGDNLDYMYDVDERFEVVTHETMWQNTGIDLHPGAKRYYQEIGAIK